MEVFLYREVILFIYLFIVSSSEESYFLSIVLVVPHFQEEIGALNVDSQDIISSR